MGYSRVIVRFLKPEVLDLLVKPQHFGVIQGGRVALRILVSW